MLALESLILFALASACIRRRSPRLGEPVSWICYVFFFSGAPALIYQIVWERALFAIYGVNVESVTIVVTGFMLGLGLGSLVGGRLSRIEQAPLLLLFGAAELCTSVYGLFSLRLFHWAAVRSAGISLLGTAIMSFALLLLPTMLMGSTLPLLTEHLVKRSHNVGGSVGMLYFVNTLGSAAACFLAAGFTMKFLGQSGSVAIAAAINAAVALSVLIIYARGSRRAFLVPHETSEAASAAAAPSGDHLKLPLAIAFVAVAGFIALAYEIIWYRLFSFWSGSNARVFATLLGAYLAGIAVGGLVVHDLTSRKDKHRNTSEYLRMVAGFVVLANLAGFAVAPFMGVAARYSAAQPVMLMLATAAALLGATFPLICHVSLAADSRTGAGLSLLYFSNIIGSALGSLLVGFVIMNFWGVGTISVFLALLGIGLGIALLAASRPSRRELGYALAAGGALCAAIVALAGPLFNGLYEKLLLDDGYDHREPFRYLVENRSGVLAVSQDGTVYGGGMYDGQFNVDLTHDVNGIFRAFALSSFHPSPRRVLMIGLSSGSWAQIVANHPQVKELTIVEINPGYLEVIPRYPDISGLFRNPKVKIVIDDGRRWLLANPDRKFDLILMNTSFNWREHMSNLLSIEFLELARRHLMSGGILYYNTTGSPEVQLTGATAFPYALRVGNFLAVSGQPIVVNADRLAATLREYRIEGRLVLDPASNDASQKLGEMIALTHRFDSNQDLTRPSMEYADSIRTRCRGSRVITDDNMGTEWMH